MWKIADRGMFVCSSTPSATFLRSAFSARPKQAKIQTHARRSNGVIGANLHTLLVSFGPGFWPEADIPIEFSNARFPGKADVT